jgi:hypothetical protein
MGLTVFLQSVFAPGFAALVVALLLAWRADPASPLARRMGPLAWIVGVFSGYWASFGLPWPLESSADWPIWAGVGGALLAICIPASEHGADRARRFSLTVLLAAGITAYCLPMTKPLVPRFWDSSDWSTAAVAAGLAAALSCNSSMNTAARFSAVRYLPAMLAWPALAAGLLMASGSARSAQTAGLAAAAAGALMLFSWLRPAGRWHHRLAVPLCALFAAMAVQHYGFGDEVDPKPLFWLAAPGFLQAGWAALPGKPRAAWIDTLALVLLTAAPLLVGWWMFASAVPADPYGPGGYGG